VNNKYIQDNQYLKHETYKTYKTYETYETYKTLKYEFTNKIISIA